MSALDPGLLAAVAAGAAVGAVLRWLLARLPDPAGVPWGTLAANVLGSALLGAVVGATGAGRLGPVAAALLGAGVAGGLSTLSTVALQLTEMVTTGHRRRALGYAVGTAALGLLAAAVGHAAAS